MAKVSSEQELVDHGIRALVDALGCSGAARFLRPDNLTHFDVSRIPETWKFPADYNSASIWNGLNEAKRLNDWNGHRY